MGDLGFNYYIYYLKKNKDDYFSGNYEFFYEDNEDYVLYAYTASKDLAKRFENERNMKMFKKEKTKATTELVAELARNYPKGILTNYVFPIYNKSETMASEIVLTELEKITIDGRVLHLKTSILSYCWYDYRIFNKEIIWALKILDYDKYNNMIQMETQKTWFYDDYLDYIEDTKIDYIPVIFEILKGTL